MPLSTSLAVNPSSANSSYPWLDMRTEPALMSSRILSTSSSNDLSPRSIRLYCLQCKAAICQRLCALESYYQSREERLVLCPLDKLYAAVRRHSRGGETRKAWRGDRYNRQEFSDSCSFRVSSVALANPSQYSLVTLTMSQALCAAKTAPVVPPARGDVPGSWRCVSES